MTIRALIFDVGGVLLRRDAWPERHVWERRLGLPEGGLTQALWRAQTADRAVLGDGDAPTTWQRFGREHSLHAAELAELRAAFNAHERADPQLIAFVRGLRPRYRTALLSNAYSDARAAFARHGIADIADELLISAELGLAKPDPRIYRLAAARLGVQPEQTVFVDDVPHNVAAAQAIGMRGVVCVTPAQTIADVQQQLV